MRIDILTLFPEMFNGPINESMLKIAQKKGLAQISIHNIRIWTDDNHRTADDKPFGGGPGMVMKVEPVDRGIAELRASAGEGITPKVILLTPQGETFNQPQARSLSKEEHVIFVCGHYEGFDERIRSLVDMELSIGDYILTCGELPAMVICDAIVRLIPGVLGDKQCLEEESFECGMLEYPQYTRPSDYEGNKVPEILLSGDPKKIEVWRTAKAVERTKERRPDLLVNSKEER
jgi:tRNA (guanine37-N1)-methyltransferase